MIGRRIYASDLPQDRRWPYFVTPRQMEEILNMIRFHEFDPEQVNLALAKPPQHHTHGTKRMYWEHPPDTIVIRLTNGERHALLAAAAGVAHRGICTSMEIRGVTVHLLKRAKDYLKAVAK